MAQHKFAVGQVVAFLPTSADGNVRRGQYTVQRLLPSEQGRDREPTQSVGRCPAAVGLSALAQLLHRSSRTGVRHWLPWLPSVRASLSKRAGGR
jgi:hypothetical protein